MLLFLVAAVSLFGCGAWDEVEVARALASAPGVLGHGAEDEGGANDGEIDLDGLDAGGRQDAGDVGDLGNGVAATVAEESLLEGGDDACPHGRESGAPVEAGAGIDGFEGAALDAVPAAVPSLRCEAASATRAAFVIDAVGIGGEDGGVSGGLFGGHGGYSVFSDQ